MHHGSQRESNRLGERLRRIRETRCESLAEVSGAVEIDAETLERIESGMELPSEDILTLLINHFSLQEQEAVQLWEWAGFDRAIDGHTDGLNELASKAAVVIVAIDARVLYSDDVAIHAGKNGMVLNFYQSNLQSQPTPIARIGMNYELAEEVMQAIQRTLLQKRYLPDHPLLPPGDTSHKQPE